MNLLLEAIALQFNTASALEVFFLNDMRYINSRFTYFTYLLTYIHGLQYKIMCIYLCWLYMSLFELSIQSHNFPTTAA